MTSSRVLAALAGFALVPVAACSGDPHEAYCAEVEAQQGALAEAVADGGPAALLDALPVLEQLQEVAPADLRDEWDLLVGRVAELRDALAAADLDPATYDPADPPAGLTTAERARVEAAAGELADPTTFEAVAGVQQQARDVCGTQLVL